MVSVSPSSTYTEPHAGCETAVGDDELRRCGDIVAALPAMCLEILQREPYRGEASVRNVANAMSRGAIRAHHLED